MKTPACFLLISLVLILSATTTNGQTTAPHLNQRELIKQFEGKWKTWTGKDTSEVWDWRTYGQSYECSVEQMISGKGNPLYKNLCYLESGTQKFIGAGFFFGGWSFGWGGSFIAEKKLVIEIYPLSNPSNITSKVEFRFNTKDSFTMQQKLSNGTLRTLEFSRVK